MFSNHLKYDILNKTYNRMKRMVEMKKVCEKLLILVMLLGMLVSPIYVYAEEPSEGTGSEETEEPATPTDDPSPTPTPTQTPEPTPTPEPKIEPRLASLTVEDFNLNEAFDAEKTNYTLTVPASTSKITITATAIDGCTVFSGNGSHDLAEGKTTTLKIVVKVKKDIDPKQPTQTYTLAVTRPTESVALRSLMVSGHSLNETFSQTNYTYTMTVPYDTTSLNISAVAENDTDTVEIDGADNLEVGENEVTITVRSESGKEATYQILVTREEESEEENQTSNMTSNLVVDEKSENSLVKYILITVGCVVLIAIAAVGIIFYMKSASPEKKKEKEARKKAKKEAKEAATKKEEKVEEPLEKKEESSEKQPAEQLSKETSVENDSSTKQDDTIDVLDDIEDTKEAPTVKDVKDDILEGMDDIFDDKD